MDTSLHQSHEVLAWQYQWRVWELFLEDPFEDHQQVLHDPIWSMAWAEDQDSKRFRWCYWIDRKPWCFSTLDAIETREGQTFEEECIPDEEIETETKYCQHHERGLSTQKTFQRHVNQLLRYHKTNGQTVLGSFLRSSNSQQSQLYSRVRNSGKAQLGRYRQKIV